MIAIEKITTPIGVTALILSLVFFVIFKRGAPAWWYVGAFVLASITLAVMIMLARDYNGTISEKQGMAIGKNKCESLLGKYKLHSPYIYIENKGVIKGTAIEASWDTDTKCTKNEDNTYTLNGEDKSVHLIEVFFDGVYHEVATVVSPYKSKIIINSDGILKKRVITDPTEITPDMVRINKSKFNKSMDIFINSKIKEYIDIIENKHKNINTCFPLSYEDRTNGQTFVVLICQDYVRTLVKKDN
jgi:hypothetical protein